MTSMKLLVVTAVGLAASGCSYSNTTTTAPGVAVARSGSEQACMDYGFRPGTDSYNRCVVREADARARGRVPVSYAQANLTADAQAACSSYGLLPATPTYDRCIAREIDARRYSQEATVTTYTTPAYPAPAYAAPAYASPAYAPGPSSSTTVYSPGGGTTVYSTTTTVPPVSYSPPATTPPAGVQAFRDEFGFRYDGQGNRVDARGNIISPASTQP